MQISSTSLEEFELIIQEIAVAMQFVKRINFGLSLQLVIILADGALSLNDLKCQNIYLNKYWHTVRMHNACYS